MLNVRVFMQIAKFTLDITRNDFAPLSDYLQAEGLNASYEPELSPRGVTLKFTEATASLQHRKGIIWVRENGDVHNVAERVGSLVEAYHSSVLLSPI